MFEVRYRFSYLAAFEQGDRQVGHGREVVWCDRDGLLQFVLSGFAITRAEQGVAQVAVRGGAGRVEHHGPAEGAYRLIQAAQVAVRLDRKSTRLNSSHVAISYAVFCLK